MPLPRVFWIPLSTDGMNSRGITPPLISSKNWYAFARRLQGDHGVTIWTGLPTTRLLDVLAFHVSDLLGDGFAVSHLRGAHVGFHTEFTTHAIDQNFQVQFTRYRK